MLRIALTFWSCTDASTKGTPPAHSSDTGGDSTVTTTEETGRPVHTGPEPDTGSRETGPLDTGLPSHTAGGSGHSGPIAGTGDTATLPPGTLPDCDLDTAPVSPTTPVVVPVQDLRSAAIVGVQNVDYRFGDRLDIAVHAGATRELVVGRGGGAFFYSLPLAGGILSTDYRSVTDAHAYAFGVGDLVGDSGDEVVLGPVPFTLYMVSPPIPDGSHAAASVASATADAYPVPGLRDLGVADWNGDGADDLFFSWHAGGMFGATRRPMAPYPFGGAGVYLGPLPATPLSLLDGDAPAAWYDVMPLDIPGAGAGAHIGEHSRLIPDVDGDGKADVLAAFQGGPNAVLRHPPNPDPMYDSGGFALFSGGQPGLNQLGDERNLLVATCNSDRLDWVCGQFSIATVPVEVGDLDGDGAADLVLLADNVEVPGGCRDAAFVVTGLPRTQGPATYTQVSSAVILGDELFIAATGIDDLNHDGLRELALADNRLTPSEVNVFLSPIAGTLDIEAASLRITGAPTSDGEFGWALTSGEIDGDGVPDLVIGDTSDRSDTGAVHVVSGAAIQLALGL